MTAIEKISEILMDAGHEDEAEALDIVDKLMREYAFTRDSLSNGSEVISKLLRSIIADWIST